MRDEIDPRGLIDDVLAAGGSVAMPVVEKRRMFFRRFDGEACLEPGVFGTSHPHAGQPVVDPDFIVAPLAAFDRRGGRIGYGAGHYDKAIADLIARGKTFRARRHRFRRRRRWSTCRSSRTTSACRSSRPSAS